MLFGRSRRCPEFHRSGMAAAYAAEGVVNRVSGDFSLLNRSQKQSSKSKVIGGNSYQFGECIPPNLGYKR